MTKITLTCLQSLIYPNEEKEAGKLYWDGDKTQQWTKMCGKCKLTIPLEDVSVYR